MRAPDARSPLYWFSGGDILRRWPETGAAPLPPASAARMHGFHLAELALAAAEGRRAAHDFHFARERELRAAFQARAAWRRAAGPQSCSASLGAAASS